LQVKGNRGNYTAIKRWKKKQASSPTIKQAFVSLAFPAGEICQFPLVITSFWFDKRKNLDVD
jgi:hypothetical protein